MEYNWYYDKFYSKKLSKTNMQSFLWVSIQGNSGPMVLYLYKSLALATCIRSKSNWVVSFSGFLSNSVKRRQTQLNLEHMQVVKLGIHVGP